LLTLAIALEGGVSVVIAPTVCFDDQPGITPEEIRHRAATTDIKCHVDLWLRQASSVAHAQEQPLHLTPRPLGVGMNLVHQHSQPSDPTPTPTAPDQFPHGIVVENPQDFRLGDHPP
jgi:hypothetical protein